MDSSVSTTSIKKLTGKLKYNTTLNQPAVSFGSITKPPQIRLVQFSS